MAKSKGAPGVQNKHIYARASYLYQAASYLASQSESTSAKPAPALKESIQPAETTDEQKALSNVSRQLLSDMRSVSLKVQIRHSPQLKRTICRYCDALQVDGQTCTSLVENNSKGGKKPWADVLVLQCLTCGNSKRFPVNATRQLRKSLRVAKSEPGETVQNKKKIVFTSGS